MTKVNTKRNENTVWVVDPKGEKFEVSARNATDLVQNLGWGFVSTQSPIDANAAAPRVRRARDEKMNSVREKAAAEKKADDDKPAPRRGRGKRLEQVGVESEEPIVPFDEQVTDDESNPPKDESKPSDDLDDELAKLEAEEASRSPKDETAE